MIGFVLLTTLTMLAPGALAGPYSKTNPEGDTLTVTVVVAGVTTVCFHLVDKAGAGIPGADILVWAHGTSGTGPWYHARTDAHGNYRFRFGGTTMGDVDFGVHYRPARDPDGSLRTFKGEAFP